MNRKHAYNLVILSSKELIFCRKRAENGDFPLFLSPIYQISLKFYVSFAQIGTPFLCNITNYT